MKNQELIPAQPQAMERRPPQSVGLAGVNIEALLDKAIDAKAAVEVIKELRQMRMEDQAIAAKRAFDEAMAQFQAECPVIVKQKSVSTNSGQKAYSYAPLEDIIAQIKPYTLKHGFSFTLDSDVKSENGWVISKCIITHREGHTNESSAKFPLGGRTAIMSETQQYAAALTFGCRRVLCNAFGIVVAGEDSEERLAKNKGRGPSALTGSGNARELAAELWELMKPVRGAERNWKASNQWLIDEMIINPDESLPDVSPDRFRQIIEKVKAKLNK